MPWKLIAYIEGLDGKLGSQEYFLVRDVDRHAAITTLLKGRSDLGKSRVEVMAGPALTALTGVMTSKRRRAKHCYRRDLPNAQLARQKQRLSRKGRPWCLANREKQAKPYRFAGSNY